MRLPIVISWLATALYLVVACANTTPQEDGLDPSAEPAIEAVYSSIPSMVFGVPLRPLFKHTPEDRPVIASLARALDSAVLITNAECLRDNKRGRYLRVLYGDGTNLAVRQVLHCEPLSDADAKECDDLVCDGTWVRANDTWWMESMGMVISPDLSRWWENMNKYMAPIGNVSIPKTIKAGEPFDIALIDWDEVISGDYVSLSLEPADGPETRFGAYPVSDFFQGQGTVPAETPSGRYWLRVTSDGFSELVRIVHIE